MHPRRTLTMLRASVGLTVIALVAACGPGASTAPTTGPTSAATTAVVDPTAAPTDTPPDQVTGELTVTFWYLSLKSCQKPSTS